MKRREALKAALAATAALSGIAKSAADNLPQLRDGDALPGSGKIDVHAHLVPKVYAEFLTDHGVKLPGLPPPPPSAPPVRPMTHPGDTPEQIATRIREMDEAGVAMQILSPTITPFFQDQAVAVEAAQVANDALLAVAENFPDRFRVFAVLPIPHIEAARTELTRILENPLVAGITLSCFYGERSAADPYFESLYAELNRNKAILFLHPAVNGLCSPFITDWKLTAAAGATLEDCVIAMHLMVAGLPSRYPDIEIIVPHLGGGLATMVSRLDNQLPLFAVMPEAPSLAARRLWYDSCCHGSSPALHAAIEAFGAERILPGSDYPFLTLHEPYRETLGFIREIGLPGASADQILHRNAEGLFGAKVQNV